MSDFVKKPCKHCPYRNDVAPFLTNSRAEELAYLAQNSFNSFPCHKTIDYDNESLEESKMCAGFLTLMAVEGDIPGHYLEEGFEPSFDICYESILAMIDAYEEENKK